MTERTRTRKRSFTIDNKAVFQRIHNFYDVDIEQRDFDRTARLERYAKFRMWVGDKDWPWEDASNIPLSDMMEQSLRAQDTIHNAAMAARPMVNAVARQKDNKDKEEMIDDLIDFQIFEENEGEKLIGDAADAFINDGVITIFIPWVTEARESNDIRVFDAIPEDLSPIEYFRAIVSRSFPKGSEVTVLASGWDFVVNLGLEKAQVAFYTNKSNEVEMLVKQNIEVFDGPVPRVVDYDDILSPVRSENLQIPGPSNPGGAGHVILIDNPSIDEIKRLQRSGFYDLMTKEDADKLEGLTLNTSYDEEEEQKDLLSGQDNDIQTEVKSQNKLTRLMVFDTFDVDGDGIDEDVIFWAILELGKVVKTSYLGQMYPLHPPRRPFAEAALIPIRGRRIGISMLEMLEGLHDASKAIMDQAVDAGTISNVPFFFYRAVAGVRPEIISLQPGDGYPVSDPQRDVNFPQIGNPQAQSFALNMITLLDQMKEKTTVIGDIQLGRVPPGRSSALRTASGLALLSGQGEARPERILRRFFTAMTQVYRLIHGLNEQFLPKNKQYRIANYTPAAKDPYRQLDTRQEIAGQFDFSFKASVLNTSKQDLQTSLEVLMQTYISELSIQLGIIDSDGIYRLMRDFGKSLGQDADQYLREPQPGAGQPKIMSEEAISIILKEGMPRGRPQEGAQVHLQNLVAFMESDEFGFLSENGVQIFGEYLQTVQGFMQEEAQQQQLLQAASQFQTGGGNPPGAPAEQGVDMSNPQVQPNEMLNEDLQ